MQLFFVTLQRIHYFTSPKTDGGNDSYRQRWGNARLSGPEKIAHIPRNNLRKWCEWTDRTAGWKRLWARDNVRETKTFRHRKIDRRRGEGLKGGNKLELGAKLTGSESGNRNARLFFARQLEAINAANWIRNGIARESPFFLVRRKVKRWNERSKVRKSCRNWAEQSFKVGNYHSPVSKNLRILSWQ